MTAGAVDFLSKRESGGKPFFLFAGYLCPHFPLIVPEQYWDRYRGKIPMPEIPPGFLDGLSLNYKVQRAGFEEIGVPDDTVRRGRELYYGLTEWVDNEIGKVLAALRMHPEVAENTVIVYSSDHDENMGEHGMWWKGCMFEPSTRRSADHFMAEALETGAAAHGRIVASRLDSDHRVHRRQPHSGRLEW